MNTPRWSFPSRSSRRKNEPARVCTKTCPGLGQNLPRFLEKDRRTKKISQAGSPTTNPVVEGLPGQENLITWAENFEKTAVFLQEDRRK